MPPTAIYLARSNGHFFKFKKARSRRKKQNKPIDKELQKRNKPKKSEILHT